MGRRRDRGRSGHARSADHDADPAGHRLPPDWQPEGRHDRNGPRADGDRDAARERRGRQIRRILRRRAVGAAARRSRNDRQHVAGVRQHLRDLSDRRRDDPLPRIVRPRRCADPAGRGVCQGARTVAHRRAARSAIHRRTRTRPRRGRAEYLGAESTARSHRAQRGCEHVRQVPQGSRRQRGSIRQRDEGRRNVRSARRRGADRGDHELHQHVQPVRDDRRRSARAERRGARPAGAAMGQNQPGPRLSRRQQLSRSDRAHARPRRARIQRRRVRLHDLHRQFRAARRIHRCRGARQRPARLQRAVGQPELRGPYPPARQDEFPRVTAARRCVRARRLDGRRPDAGRARQ